MLQEFQEKKIYFISHKYKMDNIQAFIYKLFQTPKTFSHKINVAD